MRTRTPAGRRLACALTLAAWGAPAVQGQELEEVIITSTRHEEPLSKVPISVSVATAETMERKNIRDISDLARYTPGLTIDNSGTGGIAIRGISSSYGAGTTGIYIDDTPIQVRSLGADADNALIKVFDLDRIEVLRGPQGTLFGSGSEGGTVRYISRQPSLTEFSGHSKLELGLTQGGASSYEAGLAGGGPIVEGKLGFRASAWLRRDGGYIDRIDPVSLSLAEENANFSETRVLRFAATWQPVEALKITPAVFYQERDRHLLSYYPSFSDPGDNRFVSSDPTTLSAPDQLTLPSLTIDANFGPVQLISTTSFLNRDDTTSTDGTVITMSRWTTYAQLLAPFLGTVDLSLVPLVDGSGFHIPRSLSAIYKDELHATTKHRNFTQEIRLQSANPDARLTWTLGGYFQDNRQTEDSFDYWPYADEFFQQLFGATYADTFSLFATLRKNPDGSTFLEDGTKVFTNHQFFNDRQYAGFGEASYKITPALTFTLGARTAKSKVHIFTVQGGAVDAAGLIPTDERQSESPFTPRASVAYQLSQDHLLYTTYSEGFRPGGANPRVPFADCSAFFIANGLTGNPLSYNSDSVSNFEVGAKNNFDNRVRIASSIYYIKWKDIQQAVTPPGCGNTWGQNLGEGESKGFDIQAELVVTDALRLDVAAGYTEARYSKDAGFNDASGTFLALARKGNAIVSQDGLPIAPWTGAIGAQYSFAAFAHSSYVRADLQYASSQKWRAAFQDPTTIQFDPLAPRLLSQSFMTVRAGVSGERWTANLFVDNLLDTHRTLASSHSEIQELYSELIRVDTYRPRTIGISGTYAF